VIRRIARGAAMACAGAAALAGCTKAYQNAYDQETARLEQQQQLEQSEQRALHAEAQRYASVVYFATGSSQIQEAGFGELDWFVQQMQPYPQATFEVNGFADITGSEATNQRLSAERADAVAGYLASRGIDRSRIYVQSFSTQFPAASNARAQGRRDNRRVEVTVR
jgi:outer membrane protein OmpA-like peptidoglycan-associated protein